MEYDILSIEEQSVALKIEANEICALKNLNIQRHGVRRFENGNVFQTSRLGQATKDELIDDAKKWGGLGMPHDFGFAPAHTEARSSEKGDLKFLEAFKEGLETLKQKHPDFIFSGRCTVQNLTKSLQSSYGLDLKTSGGFCEWYYVYQRKGSGNMLDGFFGGKSSQNDIQDLIQKESHFIKVQGKEIKLNEGRMPVLIQESLQPLGKLIESLSIHKYEQGSALYSGKLKQKIFSDKISLIDQAYNPVTGQINFFDGDGVVRSDDLKLIDQGEFVSLISDLRFSKKFNKKSTGNGLRAYNRGVQLAPRALVLGKGISPLQTILNKLDRCLVVIVASGGDSNDLGEFSTPVQIGYVLEKGQVIGQAPQVTIKSSIDRYLGADLIDVSSDGYSPSYPSPRLVSEMDVFVN